MTGLRLDRVEDLCLLTMALQLRRAMVGIGMLPKAPHIPGQERSEA